MELLAKILLLLFIPGAVMVCFLVAKAGRKRFRAYYGILDAVLSYKVSPDWDVLRREGLWPADGVDGTESGLLDRMVEAQKEFYRGIIFILIIGVCAALVIYKMFFW